MNRKEHAAFFREAECKVMSALTQKDLLEARQAFAFHEAELAEANFPKDIIAQLFQAWLTADYYKDNMPLFEWYRKKHHDLTQDEEQVLKAARESVFDIFRVKRSGNGWMELENPSGKDFTVEIYESPCFPEGTVLCSLISSMGNGNYFFNGPAAVMQDGGGVFERAKKHRAFTDSWNNTLVGFHDYLAGDFRLSESTVDKHEGNVEALLFQLEEDGQIRSFRQVSVKTLQKLPSFIKKHMQGIGGEREVFYSLSLFFEYLAENGQENPESQSFLRRKIKPKQRKNSSKNS